MTNFNKIAKIYFTFILAFTIIISIFFIPFLENPDNTQSPTNNQKYEYIISSSGLCWPLPGYTYISSPFGYRDIPTAGATSFHGGIDLPAPPGTNIISAVSGKVLSTGFMGSGGCTVVVQNNNYTVIFHHVSPNFLVQSGQTVEQGQVIAQVGPKNVYGFANNPYRDSSRKPYKWFYNWTTFALYCKSRW